MISRESIFFKDVTKRGNIIKTASCGNCDGSCKVKEEKQVETQDDAHNVLDKFNKSEDIPDTYIQEHKNKLEKGNHPTEVISDFFKGLHEVKAKKTLTIRTAKIFRQAGIFKMADRKVYQDLETGDFWKIQGGNVVRMFNELDGGIADRVSDKHTSVIKLASLDDELEKLEEKEFIKESEPETKVASRTPKQKQAYKELVSDILNKSSDKPLADVIRKIIFSEFANKFENTISYFLESYPELGKKANEIELNRF